ncbi:ferrous iron transport protein B [Elusimicrobium posterum]|uniref:FeoB small GTPase domain-containing protein n=1 Tax=Elusimicrobium posterum TaxID=3116653 RepID=UPI003C73713A
MSEHTDIIKKLSSLKPEDKGTITAINSKEEKTLKKLRSLGISVGTSVKIKKSSNPMVLEVVGTEVALGKHMASQIDVRFEVKKIILVGNPNVGKSAVFSRLTGVKAVSSNFPGTTVSLKQSITNIGGKSFIVFDVPGIYSLEPNSKADEEAVSIIKKKDYDLAICVLDAMHLERSLFFALQMIELGKPIILLVNKSESAKTKGITIDAKMLHRILGVPSVPVEALSGEGFKKAERVITRMVHFVKVFLPSKNIPASDEGKWKFIGEATKTAQQLEHKHPTILQKLAELSTIPVTGIPIAIGVLIACFFIVLNTGEFIISLLEPLYEDFYLPFITNLIGQEGIIGTLLVGNGTENSLGVLTEGLKIALIDVMPFVLVFYALLEFLADLGYLPRLSVLLDSMLHKIGIHGYGAIPIMLGMGCKVPAVMSVRTLESRRERIIAFVLVLIMVPCISQSAMIMSVLAPHGLRYVAMVFGILLFTGIIAGAGLNKIMKGNPPEMFMEIPAWQMPKPKEWLAKVWMRMKEYLLDALPLILIGVLIINLAEITGVLAIIANFSKAPIETLFNLPSETSSVMLLGFLRKDVSIALLEPFNLTAAQLVTASIFMTMYVPCIATFFVMLKEAGVKDTLKIVLLTFMLAVVVTTLTRLLFLI